MNREFYELYNRELDLFYEHAAEYAEEYPDVAARLGSLLREHADPMAAGLLEGAAFLAARVQLKLKHEFPEFVNNLIEQLVPNYLAPTPSALLAKITPRYGDPALLDGANFARDALLDATYKEANRNVVCRYTTAAPLQIWPFYLSSAEYLTSAGALQPLGVRAPRNTVAALRLSLVLAQTSTPWDEAAEAAAKRDASATFAATKARALTFHLIGAEAHASAAYEQIFGRRTGVWLRYFDPDTGAALGADPENDCVEPIGFDETECLIPKDDRLFFGFDLLRDYFLFPQKFLGFSLRLDETTLKLLPSHAIEVIIGFDEANASLASAVTRDMFALYAASAVNLFEKTTDRIPIKRTQYEYHVIPDKSAYLDYEAHSILEVFAHFPGGAQKQRVRPLYAGTSDIREKSTLRYTLRRVMRRRTIEEKRYGAVSNYVDADMYLQLSGDDALSDETAGVAELSLRVRCSNRHLAEHLPIGLGRSDFRLVDDQDLDVSCVAGPTRPREPIVSQLRSRTEQAHTGVVAWRLINMLSLNHLGLVERSAGDNAQALREILATFADARDSVANRRMRGVLAVDSRPVVRRMRCADAAAPARGVEITVTLDDAAFDGGGAFLLGAVLDRFYAEYVALNHFTQLVVGTTERGVIMRWPARAGARRAL
jgi:type VI secretion system protein ImpG